MNKEDSILRLHKIKNIRFSAFQLCRLLLITFLFSTALSISSFAQIYNYSPINYKDFETNPAYLATDAMKNNVELSHQNSFRFATEFSSSSLKYSTYFPSAFIGVGVIMNTTKIRFENRVSTAGLALAYRNVLFNKLYLKLGAMYKLVGTNRHLGVYDYYSFTATAPPQGRTLQHNINTSLTINSDGNRFFISVGASNIHLPIGDTLNHAQFPSYYTFHLGNLMAVFRKFRGSEISYSGFAKSSGSALTFSHYTTIKFRTKISRKSSIEYGSKIGFADNSFFHIIPTFSYVRKKIRANISYNFRLDKTTFKPVYFQSLQTSLTLTL